MVSVQKGGYHDFSTLSFEFDPSQLAKAANVNWVKKNGAEPSA
jgi:hypothetical protein